MADGLLHTGLKKKKHIQDGHFKNYQNQTNYEYLNKHCFT